MAGISPADRPVIEELVEGTRAFRDCNLPAEVPPVRSGVGRLFAGLKQAWQISRWLYAMEHHTPVADLVARFQHPFLRWAVSHVSWPEMPLAGLLVLLAQLDEGRLATVEGGSLAFALAIARRYVELGGQIVYGAPVREILVEGTRQGRDRAVGVRLEGGAEHHADVVILAADGRSTHFRMLGGRYVDRATREQYET
jgi:phytoene dehydrogenase-like protein